MSLGALREQLFSSGEVWGGREAIRAMASLSTEQWTSQKCSGNLFQLARYGALSEASTHTITHKGHGAWTTMPLWTHWAPKKPFHLFTPSVCACLDFYLLTITAERKTIFRLNFSVYYLWILQLVKGYCWGYEAGVLQPWVSSAVVDIMLRLGKALCLSVDQSSGLSRKLAAHRNVDYICFH